MIRPVKRTKFGKRKPRSLEGNKQSGLPQTPHRDITSLKTKRRWHKKFRSGHKAVSLAEDEAGRPASSFGFELAKPLCCMRATSERASLAFLCLGLGLFLRRFVVRQQSEQIEVVYKGMPGATRTHAQ